jgi:isoquinoline 1-oxidoreductase subunit alpha
MLISFTVNGQPAALDLDPQTPLLWVLRENLGLTGSKFGCGIGVCGACTVHVNGQAVRSCSLPVAAAKGARVQTIEALAGDQLAAVQAAWLEYQVPQCGYCQSGMLMAVSALLSTNPAPSDADIDASITNLCRCGTYPRIRKAIHAVAAQLAGK